MTGINFELAGSDFAKGMFGQATQFIQDNNSLGRSMGSEINHSLVDLIKEIDLEKVTRELSLAMQDAFKGADFGGTMGTAAKEMAKGASAIRGEVFQEFDGLRSDIQSVIGNVFRDFTLKSLPWIGLGGAVAVGTPLLAFYVYKKAVHNIGKPQLAQKIHRVGLLERGQMQMDATFSSMWRATKNGLNTSKFVGISAYALAATSVIASAILFQKPGPGISLFEGTSCLLDPSFYCRTDGVLPTIYAAAGAGILQAGKDMAVDLYGYIKEARKEEIKPIFSKDLQRRIDDISSSTKNLKEHGGFMQNVLLHGPGGTGKTMVAEYMAKHSGLNYVMMSGGDLAQYIKRGEHVTELQKLFAAANSSNTPTLLFIDECESLCKDRSKMDRPEELELINAFLNNTGTPSKKLMVVLTTNRPNDLDPAILSRMDHKLAIDPPKKEEREKILNLYIPKFMNLEEQKTLFTPEVIQKMAKQTEGFTGRTLQKMVNAMAAKRAATDNNRLTSEIVNKTVEDFVAQETTSPEKPKSEEAPVRKKRWFW